MPFCQSLKPRAQNPPFGGGVQINLGAITSPRRPKRAKAKRVHKCLARMLCVTFYGWTGIAVEAEADAVGTFYLCIGKRNSTLHCLRLRQFLNCLPPARLRLDLWSKDLRHVLYQESTLKTLNSFLGSTSKIIHSNYGHKVDKCGKGL